MKDNVIGVRGQYRNASLSCGMPYFMHITDKNSLKVWIQKKGFHNITFAGLRIIAEPFGFCLSQTHYASKLKILPTNAMFSDFRSLSHRFLCFCHTRPDICCSFNMSVHDTNESFGLQNIKEANKIVSHMK